MAVRTAIALALLYWVVQRSGAATLRQFFAATWLAPLLLGLPVIGVFLESRRLNAILGSQGVQFPLLHGCKLVAVSTFFSLCIPGGTGGDVMKIYYLATAHRGRTVELATVVLVDRICAMFWLLIIILILAAIQAPVVAGNPVLSWLVIGAFLAATALAVAAAISCSELVRNSRIYTAVLHRLPFQSSITRVLDAFYAFRKHKKALARSAVFAIAMHLTLACLFAMVGLVVLPQAPILLVCLLSLLSLFANALPLTPGGLGVGEAAFTALFAAAGFPGAAPLMLGWRLGMFAVAAAGCMVYIRGLHSENQVERAGAYKVDSTRSAAGLEEA
jgi:uncharacterized protein (TIRG00374 family)